LLGSHNEQSLEPEEDIRVTPAEDSNPDAAILNEIRQLTGRIATSAPKLSCGR